MDSTKEEVALAVMLNRITVMINEINPANTKLRAIERLMDALKEEVALTFMLDELKAGGARPRVTKCLMDTFEISEEEANILSEDAFQKVSEAYAK